MKEIISKFNFKGAIETVVENKSGLINSTFILISSSEKYILQKINSYIFPAPIKLMENIELITNSLKELGKESLEIVKSKDGKSFIEFNNDYWRAFKYIDGNTFLKVKNISIVSESARCLANFHKNLHYFPIENLHITIPDFHNLEIILNDFQASLLNAPEFISEQCIDQINYILSKAEDCKIIQKFIFEKRIPLRVCHNDPKISNFLFDDKQNAICLIDLDTVMPGTLLTDIADAIRTICVSESEEESDLTKVNFRDDYFELFIESYLNVNNLNKYEVQNIVKAIELIFLEQGTRFLTDFLASNQYFKVSYENQNLVRAKNQLYLSKQIALDSHKLIEIVRKCSK